MRWKDSNCTKPLPRREAISKRKARRLAKARVKFSSRTESFWKTRCSLLRRKTGSGRVKALVGRGKPLPAPAKNEFDRSKAVFLLVEPPISRTWRIRVLWRLAGVEAQLPELTGQSILLAEDLPPSVLISMDRTRLAGFATVRGGPTSHVAILARSMGMPAVAGLPVAALALSEGEEIVLNGDDGLLETKPTSERLRENPCGSQSTGSSSRREPEDGAPAGGDPGWNAD